MIAAMHGDSNMQPAVMRSDASTEYWFDEGCFIVELCNSDHDPQVSIARARVPGGGSTRWHRLVNISERYVLLSGQGRVEVGELPAQDVGPGDVVLIPPGCRQRITNIGAEPLVFLAICTPRFRSDAYEDVESLVTLPPRQ